MGMDAIGKSARLVATIFGIIFGLCAYFFFGFHFWQSIVIAAFVYALFSFLATIALQLQKLSKP